MAGDRIDLVFILDDLTDEAATSAEPESEEDFAAAFPPLRGVALLPARVDDFIEAVLFLEAVTVDFIAKAFPEELEAEPEAALLADTAVALLRALFAVVVALPVAEDFEVFPPLGVFPPLVVLGILGKERSALGVFPPRFVGVLPREGIFY